MLHDQGSSPRVWGQDGFLQNYHKCCRIIPTRMGTRLIFCVLSSDARDHPHAYGDKRQKGRCWQKVIGSSPRVWGQDHINGNRTDNRRIIPTRMGTSVRNRYFVFLRRDHPHAYGDKSLISLLPNTNLGSSPRVWGQATKRALLAKGDRIIPTRMGTRPHKWQQNRQPKDHPHAYGDKREKPLLCVPAPGSSPRVWGQVFRFRHLYSGNRIIPTRMGTSIINRFFRFKT